MYPPLLTTHISSRRLWKSEQPPFPPLPPFSPLLLAGQRVSAMGPAPKGGETSAELALKQSYERLRARKATLVRAGGEGVRGGGRGEARPTPSPEEAKARPRMRGSAAFALEWREGRVETVT